MPSSRTVGWVRTVAEPDQRSPSDCGGRMPGRQGMRTSFSLDGSSSDRSEQGRKPREFPDRKWAPSPAHLARHDWPPSIWPASASAIGTMGWPGVVRQQFPYLHDACEVAGKARCVASAPIDRDQRPLHRHPATVYDIQSRKNAAHAAPDLPQFSQSAVTSWLTPKSHAGSIPDRIHSKGPSCERFAGGLLLPHWFHPEQNGQSMRRRSDAGSTGQPVLGPHRPVLHQT